jgi:hypothetical protein
VTESSKEGHDSKRTVLPMMMMKRGLQVFLEWLDKISRTGFRYGKRNLVKK